MIDFRNFNKSHKKKESFSIVKRILLLPLCGLGDSVCYIPTIKAIRQHYPKAKIVVLVTKYGSEILEHSYLDIETIAYDRSFQSTSLELLKILCKLRKERFDLVMSRGSKNSFRIPLVAFFSGAKYRVGTSSEYLSFLYNCRVNVDENAHLIERYRQILQGVGIKISPANFYPILKPTEADKESAEKIWRQSGFDFKDRIVGLASGADVNIRGKWKPSLKRWQIEGYAEIVKWLSHDKNIHMVMFGVENEGILAEKISALSGLKIVNFCGKTSIGELQWLIAKCVALVCNDSGIMHLSAALGTSVVALFGPTSPDLFGPFGDKHYIVRGAAHCSPCFPHPTCDLIDCIAMNAIKPEQIIECLNEILSN